jgi:hypothetical protein
MARRRALIITANGEMFRFYYDLEQTQFLHIAVQHDTTLQDAVQTFFNGHTEPWDEVHARYTTMTPTHGIHWTRHAFDQSVIIISCFKRGDE